MAEAALVLPLLMLVIFAMVEFGHAAELMHTLENAAREGARWSAMPAEGTTTLPTASAVEQRVEDYAADAGLTLSSSDISVDQDVTIDENGLPTTFSQVDVTYTDNFVTPLLSSLIPSITLAGHAVMRNETN